MHNTKVASDHLFRLDAKTMFITGASSGIGRAIAIGLASAGANIVGIGRDESKLADVQNEIKQMGKNVLVISADVTNENQMKSAVKLACDTYGKIDGAVLSAGINFKKPAFELTLDEFRNVTQTNLDGMFISVKEVGRVMTEHGGGSIVTISSLSSILAYSNNSAYCASKAGVSQLTKVLAVEWAPYNIRVNALCPGRIETPLIKSVMQDPQQMEWMMSRIPMKRMGTPDELVGATQFLLSNAASYITGVSLVIDGGWSVHS